MANMGITRFALLQQAGTVPVARTDNVTELPPITFVSIGCCEKPPDKFKPMIELGGVLGGCGGVLAAKASVAALILMNILINTKKQVLINFLIIPHSLRERRCPTQ